MFTLYNPRILHIISRKSWYSMQPKSWWWAVQKIRKNLMLAKYTCFTVSTRTDLWKAVLLFIMTVSLTVVFFCCNLNHLFHALFVFLCFGQQYAAEASCIQVCHPETESPVSPNVNTRQFYFSLSYLFENINIITFVVSNEIYFYS